MFSCRPLNAKIHMAFIMFSGYRKLAKNAKKYWKKYFGARFYFSPTWPIDNLWLHSLEEQGSPHPVDQRQYSLLTTNHNPILMRGSKDLWKWLLVYYQQVGMYSGLDVIRCSSLSDKITIWPKTTRNTEICKYLFYMKEDLYVDIFCMKNFVKFIVQIWRGEKLI